MRSSVPLYLCLLLCACLGVACVAGVCVWNSQWHGGFAWDDSGLKFNWHPVLMVSGLVVVYGFGEYGPPSVWGERGLVVVYGFGEYGPPRCWGRGVWWWCTASVSTVRV